MFCKANGCPILSVAPESSDQDECKYLDNSQINPILSASVSPSPKIPPEHTLIPASRTAAIVSNRSSYERVVITCCVSDYGQIFNQPQICPHFGVILPRGIKVMVICGQTTENHHRLAMI